MGVSTSKLVGFGAVALLAYMTWSAVDQAPASFDGAGHRAAGSNSGRILPTLAEPGTAPTRDPFRRLGEDVAGRPGGAERREGVEDLRLTGVMVSGARRFAYINGKRVRGGDRVGDFLVESIEFNRVTVSDGASKHSLWLSAAPGKSRPAAVADPTAAVEAQPAPAANAMPTSLAAAAVAALSALATPSQPPAGAVSPAVAPAAADVPRQ